MRQEFRKPRIPENLSCQSILEHAKLPETAVVEYTVGETRKTMSNHARYAQHSRFTDPGPRSALLDDLPVSVPDVCAIIQSLLLSVFEAHLYGVKVPQKHMANIDIEHVSELLTKIVGIDDRPLSLSRSPENRLPVCCRQFASITCSILRHKGVPSRTRGGFADYLSADAYVGHSICEYWQEHRWIRIDPQIDEIQKSVMQIDFDPLDIRSPHYLTGAEAWRQFRDGEVPEGRFQGGLANLRNLVALDLLELNCLETHAVLPGILASPKGLPSVEEIGILDLVTDQILAKQNSFEAMRSIYEAREEFQIANNPMQATPNGAPDV